MQITKEKAWLFTYRIDYAFSFVRFVLEFETQKNMIFFTNNNQSQKELVCITYQFSDTNI